MGITGDTATDAVKQSVVSALVQRELIAGSVLAQAVLDVSKFAVDGADEILIPRLSSFTAQKKTSGTALTPANLTYATDTLQLNQHCVVQWLIEKKAKKQAAINLELENLKRAARAHVKQIDVDISAELVAGVSASAPDHIIAFAGSGFDKIDIIEASRLLDVQEVPTEDRYLAVHPTEHATMLNIDGFIDASKYGSAEPIQNGEIGRVYGLKVLKTTAVAAGRPLIFHKEALAIGFQLNPEYDQQKSLADLGVLYSLDQLYGVKTMLAGKGTVRLGGAT